MPAQWDLAGEVLRTCSSCTAPQTSSAVCHYIFLAHFCLWLSSCVLLQPQISGSKYKGLSLLFLSVLHESSHCLSAKPCCLHNPLNVGKKENQTPKQRRKERSVKPLLWLQWALGGGFFSQKTTDRARRNCLKLHQGTVRLDIGRNFFLERAIKLWNGMPREMVKISEWLQETPGCGSWCHGLVDQVVFGQRLDPII